MLHTPFTDQHETPTEQPPADRFTVTVPTLAACGAAALAVILFDMVVPTEAIPPELRGLALVVILTAAVGVATIWIDRRNESRHQELLASRRPGDCCAVAWVDGRAGRPFPSAIGSYQGGPLA